MTKREHEGSSSIHFKHFKYHLQIEMAVSSKKNFAFFKSKMLSKQEENGFTFEKNVAKKLGTKYKFHSTIFYTTKVSRVSNIRT